MGLDFEIGCINCKRFISLGKFGYSDDMYYVGEKKFKRFLGLHSNHQNSKCKFVFGNGDNDPPWFNDLGAAKDWSEDILSLSKTKEWNIFNSSNIDLDITSLGNIEIGCLKCKSYIIVDNEKHSDGFYFKYEHLHYFLNTHNSHKEIIVHFSSTQKNKIPWKNKKTSINWSKFDYS